MANGNLAYGLVCDTEKYFDREDRRIVNSAEGLADLLRAHGLDYTVDMVQLKNPLTDHPIPFFASIRRDTGAVLGAGLTDRYTPIQNRDGFAAIADIGALRDGVMFARGMTFDAGRVAVAQIDLGEMVIGEGRGGFQDRVRNRITWTNSHDGSGAAQIFVTPTRIVCANTLTAAMSYVIAKDKDGKEIKSRGRNWADKAGKFTIRHTKNADARLDEARAALQVIDGALVRTEKTYQALAYTKVTNDHIRAILADLFPTEDKTAERGAKTRQEAVEAIKFFYDAADGHRIDPNSGWNLYNAITHYNDHTSPVRIHGEDKSPRAQQEARAASTLTGAILDKNAKALKTIVQTLEIQDEIEKLLASVDVAAPARVSQVDSILEMVG